MSAWGPWGWLGIAASDSTTALSETRAWLAAERDARIAELEAQLAASEDEKRRFQRMYGKASATIGAQRDTMSRLRADKALLTRHPAVTQAAMNLDPADTARVGDADCTPDTRPFCWAPAPDRADGDAIYCTRRPQHRGQHVSASRQAGVEAVWPNTADADAALVATAEHLGNEVGHRVVTGAEARGLPVGSVVVSIDAPMPDKPVHVLVRARRGWWDAMSEVAADLIGEDVRFAVLYVPGASTARPAGTDRTAAIEGAAITLRAHVFSPMHRDTACSCGWDALQGNHSHTPPQGEAREAMHARHVAEQLAAVGALGNLQLSVESSAPVSAITREAVDQLARVLNAGDHKLDELPAWDDLADEGRLTYQRLARFVLRAGYRHVTEKAATS